MKAIKYTEKTYSPEMTRDEWLAFVYLQMALEGKERFDLGFASPDPEINMDFTEALEHVKYRAC